MPFFKTCINRDNKVKDPTRGTIDVEAACGEFTKCLGVLNEEISTMNEEEKQKFKVMFDGLIEDGDGEVSQLGGIMLEGDQDQITEVVHNMDLEQKETFFNKLVAENVME